MQTTPPAAAEAAEVMLRAGIEDEANAPAEAGKAVKAATEDAPKEAVRVLSPPQELLHPAREMNDIVKTVTAPTCPGVSGLTEPNRSF